MLKIFKFSLLFTLSLNLFANSITTDFMQKDFKITYEWLAEKPKSSAKDFFILQYLQDEELSYENAKKAYQSAWDQLVERKQERQILQIKLESVGILVDDPEIERPLIETAAEETE